MNGSSSTNAVNIDDSIGSDKAVIFDRGALHGLSLPKRQKLLSNYKGGALPFDSFSEIKTKKICFFIYFGQLIRQVKHLPIFSLNSKERWREHVGENRCICNTGSGYYRNRNAGPSDCTADGALLS